MRQGYRPLRRELRGDVPAPYRRKRDRSVDDQGHHQANDREHAEASEEWQECYVRLAACVNLGSRAPDSLRVADGRLYP
ncbi:MAG TPA: hypothetical protein VK988_05555 [Acidimicrobiales bacterium]|nr:hypothetical protein [Acidimicrobiales bacterium]